MDFCSNNRPNLQIGTNWLVHDPYWLWHNEYNQSEGDGGIRGLGEVTIRMVGTLKAQPQGRGHARESSEMFQA